MWKEKVICSKFTGTFVYLHVTRMKKRQVIAMREFGVPEKNMVIDKQSARISRGGLSQTGEKIKTGDTLVIKSIDRLVRNYDDVLEQWRLLTKRSRWILWCSICRFWIRGRDAI